MVPFQTAFEKTPPEARDRALTRADWRSFDKVQVRESNGLNWCLANSYEFFLSAYMNYGEQKPWQLDHEAWKTLEVQSSSPT